MSFTYPQTVCDGCSRGISRASWERNGRVCSVYLRWRHPLSCEITRFRKAEESIFGLGSKGFVRVQSLSDQVLSSGLVEVEQRRRAVQEWIQAWRVRTVEGAMTGAGCGGISGVAVEAAAARPAPASAFSHTLHWGLSLAALYAANTLLAKACKASAITFPSPLIGMFIIVASLLLLSTINEAAAEKVYDAFQPAVTWVQRWLPLFYVPTLVTLPLAMRGIPGSELVKVVVILCLGMVSSLLVTAQAAVLIRGLVNTAMEPATTEKPLPPFERRLYYAWGVVLAVSLVVPLLGPPAQLLHYSAVGAGLAGTVLGYLVGSAFSPAAKKLLHPIITCGALGNAAAAAHGWLAGLDYQQALMVYLSKDPGRMGGGDILMSFLGVVILSFAFKIYSQRRLMRRHAPEIFGACIASALFSLFITAWAGRTLGVPPGVTRALVARSVTVALAIPIAQQLQAPDVSITALAVVLTGIIGANFAQALLDLCHYRDPIARGLATAGSAHGLGTAALAAKEPEALPFCALAYALIGIISTVVVSVPSVRAALLAITG